MKLEYVVLGAILFLLFFFIGGVVLPMAVAIWRHVLFGGML